MKYFVCEGTPEGAYNASTKARKDAEYILKNLNFKEFYIETKYGVQQNKLLKFKQLIDYRKNCEIWMKTITNLKKDDILLIQYPLINTMLGFEKVMEKLKEKGVITIILIHDLDSLRFIGMPRVVKEDRNVINKATYIIAHNKKMKEKLIEMCKIDKDRTIELEIFDYILDNEIIPKERKKDKPIVIAGNLSKEKAEYLKYLKNVNNVTFNLYGKGYQKDEDEKNINYTGAFLPEELINNLDGSFGLVWDGNSIDTCSGPYGEYLKYNNPHKTSLYLTAMLPVIVWKNSAMAEFVENNKVGITIERLEDISFEIQKITDEEYSKMIENTKAISEKLKRGEYLRKSIYKISEGK